MIKEDLFPIQAIYILLPTILIHLLLKKKPSPSLLQPQQKSHVVHYYAKIIKMMEEKEMAGN